MKLHQLRYFEAVASTLNFSRAAERLHVAQPPLSRQIQQLENELGVPLLDRTTRPMRLTNAGQFFYDQTVQVLGRITEMQEATRRLAAEGTRWMGIGFVPSILYGFLPKVLREFSVRNENIKIALTELTSVQQAQALKAGRIDVGFGRLAIKDESLENILLTKEPLVAAVPTHSPLGRKKHVSLKEILNETLVLYPSTPRPSFADEVMSQIKSRGYEVNKIYETNGLQTAIGLVAAGMGVTIVPESVQNLQRVDIAYRPLSNKGLASHLLMTVRAGDSTEHVAKFCTTIRKAATPKPATPSTRHQ